MVLQNTIEWTAQVYLASTGFHFQNINVGVTEKRCTCVFIAKFIEMLLRFFFEILLEASAV